MLYIPLLLLRVSSFASTLATHHSNIQYVWNDTIVSQSNKKYIIAHETSPISYLMTLYTHHKHGILRYFPPTNHPSDPSALPVHSKSTELQHDIIRPLRRYNNWHTLNIFISLLCSFIIHSVTTPYPSLYILSSYDIYHMTRDLLPFKKKHLRPILWHYTIH